MCSGAKLNTIMICMLVDSCIDVSRRVLLYSTLFIIISIQRWHNIKWGTESAEQSMLGNVH